MSLAGKLSAMLTDLQTHRPHRQWIHAPSLEVILREQCDRDGSEGVEVWYDDGDQSRQCKGTVGWLSTERVCNERRGPFQRTLICHTHICTICHTIIPHRIACIVSILKLWIGSGSAADRAEANGILRITGSPLSPPSSNSHAFISNHLYSTKDASTRHHDLICPVSIASTLLGDPRAMATLAKEDKVPVEALLNGHAAQREGLPRHHGVRERLKMDPWIIIRELRHFEM